MKKLMKSATMTLLSLSVKKKDDGDDEPAETISEDDVDDE